MPELSRYLENYLEYCRYQKGLDTKTCKAYRIDLTQVLSFLAEREWEISKSTFSEYITQLHKRFQPRSAKRKVASMKAFFNYLEYEELLEENPFSKMRVKFKEPFLLPRTIPLTLIEEILASAYCAVKSEAAVGQKSRLAQRDVAVLEMLFATGIRVSELCTLKAADVDLTLGVVKIYGKGAKERIVQIGNPDVVQALAAYQKTYQAAITQTGYYFINRLHHRLSEQSVRLLVNRYAACCGAAMHITPHMFRHSFATLLLEEDVDIRYIQNLLGHSSITTTQIYTHVTSNKQRDILTLKHPRNKMLI